MEQKENSIPYHHIEKLAQFLFNFYDREHITKDGVSFSFNNKTSLSRIKFLIENTYTNHKDLSFSDKKEIIDLRRKDKIKYLFESLEIDDMINDNKGFKMFFISLNEIVNTIKHEIKQEEVTKEVKSTIKTILSHGKNIYEKNTWTGKNTNYFHKTTNNSGSLLLLQNDKGGYFFFNEDKGSIEYSCGEKKNKRYKFGENNKVFIFEKNIPISPEIIQEELERKTLTQSDETIKEFIEYIVYTYTDYDKAIKMEESEAIHTSIHVLSKNIANSANFLAKQIEKIGIAQTKYNLFIDSTEGGLNHIGLYNKINPAKSIPEGYKGKKAISLEIQDGERTKVLVTNGIDQDIFDYDS